MAISRKGTSARKTYISFELALLLLGYDTMITSSNGNIFRVTCPFVPVTGEYTAQRPVTRNFAVFFDLRLNRWLSKQSRRRWFETSSRQLWHHYNAVFVLNGQNTMPWSKWLPLELRHMRVSKHRQLDSLFNTFFSLQRKKHQIPHYFYFVRSTYPVLTSTRDHDVNYWIL